MRLFKHHKLLFTAILTCITQIICAQSIEVTGKIIDNKTSQSLVGANIIFTNSKDSLDKKYTTSDTEGAFVIKNLKKAQYNITISYLGYNKLSQSVNITTPNQILPSIKMEAKTENLNDITVVANTPPAVLKGDTTEYNSSAYKVTADATVEDLVKKMPGVSVEDGTVKAQGEEIKKVLVDGKPFFGDDPSIALKNLPAEIIDKVQIFDQQSEQSQLTGFNDGETSKTMNIITRQDRHNGLFGTAMAGVGDQDRYTAKVALNQFKGTQRISGIISSNNINQQNFGTQDFLGAMGGTSSFGSRGGNSGSNSSSSSSNMTNSNGISTIHSLGLNYSDEFKNKLKLSGSYFYNQTKTVKDQLSNSEYILSSDSSRMENNNNSSETKNYNNRLNFRAEWEIDSMNKLIIVPSVNFQTNKSNSSNEETQLYLIQDLLTPQNTSSYISQSESSGYSISNRMTYRHKFIKPSRTLTVDANSSFNKREPLSSSISDVTYQTTGINTLTDRKTSTLNDSYSFASNIAYTEPLGKISMVQLNASNTYTETYAYKKTNDLNTTANEYVQIDTLSNKYLNYFITNKVGLTYRLRTDKVTASVGVEMQNSNLSGDQTFPKEANTDKQFNNLLPNAQLNIKLSDMQRLRINYRTTTAAPSISQLQDVSEYSSNLTRVTKGNPNLEPQYQHNFTSRLMRVNKETRTNFFFLVGGSILQNSIGNSTVYLDTIQITTPVNKGTGYKIQSMANYGFSIKPIKCNMNLSTGYNYSRTPGFVNGNENIANTNGFSGSVVLSSNFSDKLDFNLSTSAGYTIGENSISSATNTEYYSQTTNFRLNWIFWKGLTLQNEVSNRLYKGLSSNYNQNISVVNLGLGKKMFKNKAGELRVTAYDLFNNNTSISRTITANQITDQQSTTLNRYIMATFTYTFRNFKQGSSTERKDNRDNFDRPRPDRDGGFDRGGGGPMGGSMGGPPEM